MDFPGQVVSVRELGIPILHKNAIKITTCNLHGYMMVELDAKQLFQSFLPWT